MNALPNFPGSFRSFAVAICVGLCASMAANATGVKPDAPLLVVSEADGSAQMGVVNTENDPLLMHTTIVDIAESKGPALYAIPPVTRVEANGRQVVRFLLEKSDQPMKVQSLKRVRFEGIPTVQKNTAGQSVIRMTVSQDIPVVISPKGLEQDPEPWKRVKWALVGSTVRITNESPYVARLSQEVVLLPGEQRARLLPRPYLLPGDNFDVPLPEGTDPSKVTGLRLMPGSPFGFALSPYEVPLTR